MCKGVSGTSFCNSSKKKTSKNTSLHWKKDEKEDGWKKMKEERCFHYHFLLRYVGFAYCTYKDKRQIYL